MFEQFPYADLQQLNLDWMIETMKDFRNKYDHIQNLISEGVVTINQTTAAALNELNSKATEIENILNQKLNTALNTIDGALDTELAEAIQELSDAIETKAAEALASIPADYTDLSQSITYLTAAETATVKPFAYSGAIASADGSPTSSLTRCRTGYLPQGVYAVSCNDGYKFMLMGFNAETLEYIGVWNGTTFSTTGAWKTEKTYTPGRNYVYRLVMAKTTDTSIDTTEATNNIYLHQVTDNNLVLNGIAADAGAVHQFTEAIQKHGSYEVSGIDGESNVRSGITYINNNDGSWTISGTATSTSFCIFINNRYVTPGRYYFDMDGSIRATIYITLQDDSQLTEVFTYSRFFNIPANIKHIQARFNVSNGATVPETTVHYRITRIADGMYYPGNNPMLQETGDDTDRTAEIRAVLETYGTCKLGTGKFYVHNLWMPEKTKLEGMGLNTKLILKEENRPAGNLWTSGNQRFEVYKAFNFDPPLPAGKYTLTCTIDSSDTDSDQSAVAFYRGYPQDTTTGIYINIYRNTPQTVTFESILPIVAMNMYAARSYSSSAGDTAEFSDISLVCNELSESAIVLNSECTVTGLSLWGSEEDITVATPGSRNGILFQKFNSNDTIKRGIIDSCYFQNFSNGAITMQGTGYPSDGGLNISNCYMRWNHIGINIFEWSEFHRISNCSCTNNYIGILNNGGNNMISCCNFSSNDIGVSMDNSDGTKNNNSHGGMDGCIIQHSRIRGIYINKMPSGFIFSNINLDDGGIEIIDTSRIVFTGCNFMNLFKLIVNGIYPDGGGLILFNACNFRDTFTGGNVSITNNPYVKFIACYTQNGQEIPL